jgi:GH18 family chitinase
MATQFQMKLNTLFAFLFIFLANAVSYAQSSNFRIIGYVPNWVDVNVFAQNFDYRQVTHLNYAFQNPDAAGNLVESNTGLTTLVAKAHLNQVKVLVSLGGGSAADGTVKNNFQNQIITADKRAAFIHKIIIYLTKFKLDGLDVDEEGPAINSNYGFFIHQLADSLKPKGLLLTTAVGWGNESIPNSVFQYFDWVNLMAYDLTGNWDLKNPGQHSPYSYAKKMISDFKKRGVKKEQLCLGVPFYGYGFYKNPGSFNYNDILAKYPDAWQKDQVSDTIYYNGMTTIWKKTRLALSEASGIMIWELSNDVKGDKSLLKVISGTVDSLKTSSMNMIKPKGITIYPNPADNELFIDNFTSSQGSSVEVINLLGERIKTFKQENLNSQSGHFDISTLISGTYICRVNTPEGSYSTLFVKE